MVNLASLRERYELINSLFADHTTQIAQLQDDACGVLVQQLTDELSLQQSGVDRALAFLDDPVTCFRFLRKAHFDSLLARELLRKTLRWRLTSALDLVSPSALDPLYSENPLVYLHPRIHDKFGRQAVILNLKHVVRPEDGSLDSLKEFIAFTLEITRRYLADLSKRDQEQRPHVQVVFLLDLAGANLSNLEIELLPFVVDLLKNHFPGTVGAVFVLNYGWAYAGMWQVAKRVLPRVALDRILFPSHAELLEYFDREHLLMEHGGDIPYKYRLANNYVLTKYGRPSYYLRHRTSTPSHSAHPSPAPSRPLSRVSSLESVHDAYYSVPTTPRSLSSRSPRNGSLSLPAGAKLGHHRPHPSWLDMTMSRQPSGSGTTANSSNNTADAYTASPANSTFPGDQQQQFPLPRVSSARDFREAVSASASKENSLDTFYDDVEDESDRLVLGSELAASRQWDTESIASGSSDSGDTVRRDAHDHKRSSEDLGGGLQLSEAAGSSLDSRRETSIAQLRDQLEREQPIRLRRGGGRISGSVSPYNVNNPYYGYPATRYVQSPDVPGGLKLPHVRPYHNRRRKRDLVRTLSYLAALRLLALHRKLKWRLAIFWRYLWEKLLRWGAISGRRRWHLLNPFSSASSSSLSSPAAARRNRSATGPSRNASFSSASITLINNMDDAEEDEGGGDSRRPKKKGVRWAVESDRAARPLIRILVAASMMPLRWLDLLPRWILWVAALLFLRSRFFGRNADRLLLYIRLRTLRLLRSLGNRIAR